MPKILEKQKVLGGRGLVFTYENDNVGTYFYREKIDGTKKYRLKKIDGARTLAEAAEMAMEIAIALRDDEPHHVSASVERRGTDLSADELLEREEKLVKKKERMQHITIRSDPRINTGETVIASYRFRLKWEQLEKRIRMTPKQRPRFVYWVWARRPYWWAKEIFDKIEKSLGSIGEWWK